MSTSSAGERQKRREARYRPSPGIAETSRNWVQSCAMRRLLPGILCTLLLAQTGCIWKLWSKGPPPEEVTHDVYGTVQMIDANQLVVETKHGVETFIMGPASIKGSDFGEGTFVHVYFKKKQEGDVVTMVVEKIG